MRRLNGFIAMTFLPAALGCGGADRAVNHAPVIQSLTADDETPHRLAEVVLSLQVSDEDGDVLSITWTASGGELSIASGPGPVLWTAPAEAGTYTIEVSATDPQGESDSTSIELTVLAPSWRVHQQGSALVEDLQAVAFVNESEGWAAGGEGVNDPFILHFSEGEWVDETIGTDTHLRTIGIIDSTSVLVAGHAGNGYYWNGTSWESIVMPGGCVRAIQFLAPDDGWASPHHTNSMRHYTGGDIESDWSMVGLSEGHGGSLEGMVMVGPEDGWVVGASGYIYHYTGGATWDRVSSPTTADLNDVEFPAADNGWAVGAGGTILLYDGADWTIAPDTPTPRDLFALDFVTVDDGWAVGTGGVVIHYDGFHWTKLHSPDPEARDLFGIEMLSTESGWAVGEAGVVLRYGYEEE